MIDIFTWRNAFGVEIKTPNIDRLMAKGRTVRECLCHQCPFAPPCRAELATPACRRFAPGLVDLNRLWRDVLPCRPAA